jgi:hypothetical protein
VEPIGGLPVVRVAPSLHQQVRTKSRLRAWVRWAVYGWALGEHYRIEPVFGSIKRADGSYVGCRGWCDARVQMWEMLVLWNLVQCLRVGGDGFDFLCVVLVLEEVRVQERYFRTPSLQL